MRKRLASVSELEADVTQDVVKPSNELRWESKIADGLTLKDLDDPKL